MTGHRKRWIVRKNRASRRRHFFRWSSEPSSLMRALDRAWIWFDASCPLCVAGDWHHGKHPPTKPNVEWVDCDELARRYGC